jgi:hypothetical protein
MSLSDDVWINKFTPIEPAKIHALGMITFMWNACEYKLFELFSLAFGLSQQAAWLLVHDLGDLAISDRIYTFTNWASETDETRNAAEIIQNALKAYDHCRQNRNQFTHFTMQHDLENQTLTLLRQKKGPVLERVPFPNDLADMRRVAEEIIGMNNHLHEINQCLMTRNSPQPAPWPNKVAPPALLSTPPLPDRKEPGPLRSPSVLKLTEEEWIAKCRKESRPLPDGAGA